MSVKTPKMMETALVLGPIGAAKVYDSVTIDFDYQPREDDVNVGPSVDINRVYYMGDDLLPVMSEVEIAGLESEILDWVDNFISTEREKHERT